MNSTIPEPHQLALELEGLYEQLPAVPCQGCGQCCVCPTCTLVEFLYLLRKADSAQLATLTQSVPQLHSGCEGNLICPILHAGRCITHEIRTGACRLFGVPALNDFGIDEMESCRFHPLAVSPEADADFIRGWLDRMVLLNRQLYPVGALPYALTGLNLHCWMDIYFDKTFTIPFFIQLQQTMHAFVDVRPLVPGYRSQTGIRDKIDKIHAFSELIDSGDAGLLLALLQSIYNDYPLCGTYFIEEAQQYLSVLSPHKTAESV